MQLPPRAFTRAVLLACVILLGYYHIEGLHGAAAGYVMRCPAAADDDSAIHRLKSTLFCDYDLQERPVRNRSANVTVAVSLEIMRIYIIDTTNRNEIRSWLTVVWHDEYLKWKPDNYDGIEQIEVPSTQIWMPDLAIYNAEAHHMSMFNEVRCIVNQWGRVMCVPTVSAPIYCHHDATRWPFDTRVCVVTVGSWMYNGAQLDLQLYYNGFTKSGYVENPEWELQNVSVKKRSTLYACCPKEPYVTMEYTMQLRRHAGLYAAAIVSPAFVLAGVSLASFWMRDVTPRALACLTALLGNANFLLYLTQKLPGDGDSRPSIVSYYRDAMLMSALALCVALISARLEALHGAPHWAAEVAVWLRGRGGRPGKLLLGDIYTENDKEAAMENGIGQSAAPAGDSSSFAAAAVLDRLAFLTFAMAYAILLFALLP